MNVICGSFLLLSFTVLSCQAAATAKVTTTPRPNGVCVAPKKIVDFEWDDDGVESRGYYIPLGAKSDRNLEKEMLHGTSLNPDEDLKKLCLRLSWNSKHPRTVFSGNGNNSVAFDCNKEEGRSWILNCKQLSNKSNEKDYSHKVMITLTDKKTFAFAVRCWENGPQGWTVFSKKKTLQEDTEIHILEHLKSLGFETADALPLSYKSCANSS